MSDDSETETPFPEEASSSDQSDTLSAEQASAPMSTEPTVAETGLTGTNPGFEQHQSQSAWQPAPEQPGYYTPGSVNQYVAKYGWDTAPTAPPTAVPPMPSQSTQAKIKERMQRRVAVPIWAIAATGVLMLCIMCSCIAVAANKNPAKTPNASANSGVQAHATNTLVPTITPTYGPTDTPAPTATPAPTDTPAPTSTNTPQPQWTTIQSFTGNGNKNTPTFTVSADDWRLVWSCDPSSSFSGSYNVIVDLKYSDGTDADPVAINTICQSGNTGDFTEERMSGDFYLAVNSEAAWTMQIQVFQ